LKKFLLVLFFAAILTFGAVADEHLSVVLSPQSVYVNRSEVQITGYNINGNNYYKLRDLAEFIPISVDYDAEQNRVNIYTTEYTIPAQTPQPLPTIEPRPLPTIEPRPLPTVQPVTPEITVEEHILSELLELSDEIYLESFEVSPEAIGNIYFDVIARHPELFYLGHNVESLYYDGGYVTLIRPQYNASKSTIEKQISRFDAAFEKAYSEIDSRGSAYDIVRNVNKWLCQNVRYDTTYSRYTAYDAMVDGSGVCEAYSRAFGVFMEHYGIEWRLLRSESMNHEWNQVYIDGQWLHIDVTWDDPIPDVPGRYDEKFLLLTDTEIMSMSGDDRHYDWTYWIDA